MSRYIIDMLFQVKPQPQGSSMANVGQSSVISTTLVSQPPPMSSPSYNTFSCSSQPQQNINNNAVAATALTAQLNFQVSDVFCKILFY